VGEDVAGDCARRVTLRASTPDDREFLAAVYASTRPAELALLAWSPDQQAAFVASQSRIQQQAYADQYPGASFAIVEVDGTPAGRLFVARDERELRVVDIALLADFRGAGIGTQLIGDVIAEAAARGLGVGLCVDLGSPAQRLYERLGFAVVGTSELQTSMRWTPSGDPLSLASAS
jgi:ribosomal protein S18 acetylase RimI-like enzyme